MSGLWTMMATVAGIGFMLCVVGLMVALLVLFARVDRNLNRGDRRFPSFSFLHFVAWLPVLWPWLGAVADRATGSPDHKIERQLARACRAMLVGAFALWALVALMIMLAVPSA